MYLALGIAIVQSLAVSLNLPIVSGVNASLAIFMNTILLIAGTFFLGLAIRSQLSLWDWGLHCHPDGKYDGQSALSNHG